jgi:hypothetical protein
MDPLTIWKSLSDALRAQAAEAFFADATLKDFHRAAETFIARHKNFRPQFIKKLPAEKRAFYLAHMPLSPDLASQLLVSYHFAHQRPLMAAFLNALNIPNDNGLITGDADIPTPDATAITAAVASLRPDFPAEDLQRYFATLYSQNPDTWKDLQPHLAAWFL